jgi:RNA polymerase sigma-70 factor (ECF subfamily)
MGAEIRERLEERYHRILRDHGAAVFRSSAAYEANPGDREDLYQEICLSLWKALPGFRGECSERTFFFRIAHNRGLTHAWRRRPPAMGLEEAEALPDPRPGPETSADSEQSRGRLMAAIRALPATLRPVVVLALEGVSHAEIGSVLGITGNNVAVRLSRARALLRRALGTPGAVS